MRRSPWSRCPDTERGGAARQRDRARAPRAPHRGRRRSSPTRSTTAGCVFVGEGSATAFGDYAAGSNHVLPTGGAGRFQGPLGPDAFRRRITTVEITQEAARELAPTVATLARAEGFPLHARVRRSESERTRTDGAHRRDQPRDQGDQGQPAPRPGRRRGEDLDRRRLPRPHAGAARPPRAPRPRPGGERRPARPARTTPPRTSASASGRRSTRRSATAPGSAATARRSCRWTRRSASARSTSRAGPSAPSTRTFPT